LNAALVVSDGVQARIGTLTADRERFMPWRTIAGEELVLPTTHREPYSLTLHFSPSAAAGRQV
jgi:hypothetical protein